MTIYPELDGELLLLDMDGTSVGFFPKFEQRLREILPSKAFKTWKSHEYWIEDAFEAEYHDRINAVMCEEGFFRDLEPMPGALEAIQEILDEGFKIIICTTPHPDSHYCIGEKSSWVKKHLGEEFAKHMIFTQDKTVIHGPVLIDDKPDIKGYNKNPSWTHAVFNAPYNQHINTDHRLYTWSDWRKVIYPILESSK